MSADESLLALAERHGFQRGYHDIWGHWHGLEPDVARRLLTSLGVDCDGDDAVERAHLERTRSDWRAIPPVVVTRDGEPLRLPLNTAPLAADETLHWTLLFEHGGHRSGELALAGLEVIADRDDDGQRLQRLQLELPDHLPLGYHELLLEVRREVLRTRVIRVPRRCLGVPASSRGSRPWGVSLQLYGLRSGRNWGIGDFGDLASAIDALSALGADMIGLNPLHALYPHMPDHASPYSPSSRFFLNPAYLDIESMADFARCGEVQAEVSGTDFAARLAALRASALVDYEQVLPLKLRILRRLFEHFRNEEIVSDTLRAHAFRDYVDRGGLALERHAVFQSLHEHLRREGIEPWPAAYRNADSDAVRIFREEHADDVLFHQYLQWQTDSQLERCAARARTRGMGIGLYLALAVGSDSHGADAWADPTLHAHDVSVGAPPDDLGPSGQVWGLPPWSPEVLRERAYEPFVRCLRTNMSHAGALRIDHVLGLLRVFWVPAGETAAKGAYLRYPVDDLLGIVALESVREGCVVIGEDLGTVPDELRAMLYDYGALSYRVLYFEKHWDGDRSFKQPEHYPPQALVTISTHDLGTFAGYWTGRDIELRSELGLYASDEIAAGQREERRHDRGRLLAALDAQGLRPETADLPEVGKPSSEMVEAVHRYIARAPSAIMNLQLEDALGVLEQPNVPGTVDEQPNWRRKLPLPVEAWPDHPRLRSLAAAVALERQRQH